jgi:multidrug efflux pump subunit AcrB
VDDVKNRVDAVSTFPVEAKRPVYAISRRRREAIALAIAGDIAESELRRLGEGVWDDLTSLPGISQVELTEVRPYEISVGLGRDALRRRGLSFEQVARAVRRSSLNLPAGTLKTSGESSACETLGKGTNEVRRHPGLRGPHGARRRHPP